VPIQQRGIKMCGYSKFKSLGKEYILSIGYHGGSLSCCDDSGFNVDDTQSPCGREKALRSEFEMLDKAELIYILDQIIVNADE